MAKPLKSSERQEARALIQWAKLHPVCRDYLLHVPNGGSRNKIEAYNLKLEGTRAGVSDYFLAYPHKDKPGMWLELKRLKGGVLTAAQIEWLERMRSAGYVACVAYGWESAKTAIEAYLL